MKKITFLSVSILLLVQFSFSQEKHKRIIIQNTSQSTLTEIMKLGVDLHCGAVFKENGVQLELSEFELKKLDNLGIPYTTSIEDLGSFYGERAVNDLPKARTDLKLEQVKGKLKTGKAGPITQKTISSTIKDNYLQYTGSAEVDWVTPSNFNLGSMAGCLTYSEMKAELDEMRNYSVNNGLNIVSVKQDASPSGQTTWGNPSGTITNNGLTYSGQGIASSFENEPGRDGKTFWDPETIWYVRITGNESGTPENTKPQMLFTSMIHSREVSALMNNIYFMWYLIENYNTDDAIKELVDNNELYFVPVVNPDGLKWNEHLDAIGDGLVDDGGQFQRKNLRPNTGSTTNTTPDRGVDLNRNFDYFWAYNNIGSSGTASSGTYRGPSPESEPETQIMVDFITNRNFKSAVWNHSYANSVPHPYGGIPSQSTGREDEYYKWHEEMTRYNRYLYGATIFYESNGLPDDWMMGGSPDNNGSTGSGQAIIATTPEHGGQGFWPTPSTIVPIAKQSMRISLGTAYYGGKYAKLHDLTQSNINSTTANLDFGIERVGQTGSNFTVTLTPISSNIVSITSPATQSGMNVLEQRTVTATLQLNPSIAPNEKIEYNVKLSNDNGIIYEANFEKYYQPTLLFNHIPDTNGLTGWIQSGGWTNTTADAYSGSNSLSTGTYSNNITKTLTTTNSYDFSNSTEVLIQFYSKWDIERNYDFVEVLGSPDGGSNWISLKGNYTKPEATSATTSHDNKSSTYANFQANSQGQIYDGDRMDNWVMEEIVIDNNYLSLLSSNNVKIRFNFRTDALNVNENYSTTSDGFFIDDFKIISVQIPCDNSNPPTGITADVTTSALTAIINWDAIPSATYDLRYRQIGAPSWTEITDIATNSYTINSLSDATDYEVQVGTRCTVATSSYSSSINFTATACTGGSISSFPYSESFESGLGLWSQSANGIDDDIDWTNNIGTTPSSGTGPSTGASNGTRYLYTEASTNVTPAGSPNKSALLTSSCIVLNGYENTQLEFDYHMLGTSLGTLGLEISTDYGNSFTNILNLNPASQDLWKTQTVDLSSYDGQTIKLRFNGTTGTSWSSDISIDNINITANVTSLTTWYQDSDGDTYGNASVTQDAASQPVGYVADNTDCDDNDDTINPDTIWYIGVDNDGDGYFGSTSSVTQCTAPGAGYATTAQTINDCDDNDDTINPDTIWYIGVDNDGDGYFGSTSSVTQCTAPGAGYATTAQTINDCDDNDDTINPDTIWYIGVDNDGDGYFGSTSSVTQCTAPGAGYATTAQTINDCDDNDDTINPDTIWYIGVDNDGDGYFGSTSSVTQCTAPGAGYATTAQTINDCDDNDDTINPDTIWYIGVDNDGDGYFGSTSSVTQCTAPGAGYATTAQTINDCDDNDDTINPDTIWYIGVDNDGDGYFGSTSSVTQCTAPGAGYATTAQTINDCDDNDDTINPDTIWYIGVDNDGDGYFGSTSSVTQCTAPGAGYATTAQTINDCDDNDDTINPDTIWYIGVDNDGDGYFGSTSSVTQCTAPGAGYATTAQTINDCDDNDDTINPDTIWYIGVDNDGDGYFGSTSSVTQCTAPGAGYATTAQTINDCDDNDDTINPDTIWYIGVDNDGDGYFGSTSSVTQCTAPGAGYATTAQTINDCDDNDDTINPDTIWYIGVDNDGDGYFGSTSSVTQCTAPGAGYATTAQTINDCDDNDDTINPDTIWYIGVDNDGDGYFGSTSSVTQCTAPGAGYATTAQTINDCDDNDDTINPDTIWYIGVDNDGDGYFGSTSSVTQCTAPGAGYATTAQTINDCDDNDDTINPDTIWYIGVDNDGDGYFGSTSSVTQCTAPGAGYATTAQTINDCDDNDDTINPDTIWYIGVDNDGDGYFGSTSSVTQCTAPGAGYATTAQTINDCDDNDDTINPDTIWYIGVDNDGDGYFGSTSSVTQCTAPGAGYATTAQTINDCDDNDDTINPDTIWYIGVDNDGDGYFGSTSSVTQCTAPGAGYATTAQTINDCDDNDDTINPDTIWYIGVDNDGDGYFGSTSSVTQCTAPGAGYATTAQTINDCDDNDDTINPDTIWYIGVDNDGDGYFGSTSSVTQCTAPGAGYATTAQTINDCDDNDDTINPDTIWYIGVDNDGDGYFGSTSSVTQCTAPGAGYATTAQTINDCDDNDDTINPDTIWYIGVDNDGDGYFGSTSSVTQCTAPGAGYATTAQTINDCDDNDDTINPDTIWYIGVDNDGDGYFGSTSSVTQCTAPGAGYATTAQTINDCDDNDDTINPDTIWYIGVDNDGDGYFGSTSSVTQCTAPGAGYATTAQTINDCDDNDDTINPDTIWYIGVDNDGDGYFGSTSSVTQCTAPGAGYATTAQTINDCDDNDDTINPDTIWYIGVDNDGDGYFGSTSSVTQCTAPGAGYATTAQTINDCDDNDDTINPDTIWYIGVDNDGDGYFGSTSSVTQCTAPGAGYATTAQTINDCDDNDDTINPDTIWYIGVDNDGDGYFGSTSSVTQCTAPGAGYATTAQTINDCDDNDDTINPDTIWYIGVDNDGDGYFGSTSSVTQCTAPGAGYATTAQTINDCDDNDDTINPDTIWYIGVDNDGDGYFGSTSSVTQCTAPGAGYATTAQTINDCDDNDDTINPDTIWYIGVDNDGDGYFGSTSSVTQCTAPGAGYATTAQTINDCDDNDDTINPGATEIPNNSIDENCDGIAETTLDDNQFTFEYINILPNPFNDYLTITLPLSFNSEKLNIVLFDVNGRYIYNSNKFVNKNGKINIISGLNRLNQGVYFIQVTNLKDGTALVKKLIKY